jgi:hypothetical protein
MKNIFYFLATIFILSFTACETVDEPAQEFSQAYPVCGEWVVNLTDGTGAVIVGPYRVKTYNTSFSTDSIWIDDVGTGLKAKAFLDLPNRTFISNAPYEVPAFGDTSTTINGKIVNTDSIYMTLQFLSEPGVDYIIAGHRLTGYDEYQNPWH